MLVRYSRIAERDLARITKRSRKLHGTAAAIRYVKLLKVAVDAIASDPFLIGSSPVGRNSQVRSYPIRFRRNDVPQQDRVTSPRHLVLYSVLSNEELNVVRVVHDRMLLARAASRALEAEDD